MSFGPYALAGWRVTSAIELPELIPWAEPADARRELEVELAAPPEIRPGPGFALAADGVRFHVRGVAIYRISSSSDRVVVHPFEHADPLLVRTFLYSWAIPVLCFHRGLLPLHAASVRLGEGAALFCGPSGAGKSTFAAALALRGYPLLSDDISVIDVSGSGGIRLWPTFPRVKLRDDTIEALGLQSAAVYTRASRGPKGHFGMVQPETASAAGRSIPVSAIYCLSQDSAPGCERVRLETAEAVALLGSHIHRRFIGHVLGVSALLFDQVCAVARTVPVYRLERPLSLDLLGDSAVAAGFSGFA